MKRGAAPSLIDLISERGGPRLDRLEQVRISHNGAVYHGEVDGDPVFLKHYTKPVAPELVRKSVAETEAVQKHMTGHANRIVDIFWSDTETGLVLMEAASGISATNVLKQGHAAAVMPRIARWLDAYIGPRRKLGVFAPRHWVSKWQATDISALQGGDQSLIAEAILLQDWRARQLGGPPAIKAFVPSDFAPHNLIGTDKTIWGIDIERANEMPLSRALAGFAVIAERHVPPARNRTWGLSSDVIMPLHQGISRDGERPMVLPFCICDCLIEALFRRHTDPKTGPATRTALKAHLLDAKGTI